jgi:WD40 repeat protein
MLGFGGAQEPSSVSSIETPFGQPGIHSSNLGNFSNPTVKKSRVRYRTVEREPCERLRLTKEFRGYVRSENHLMSVGHDTAIAMDQEIVVIKGHRLINDDLTIATFEPIEELRLPITAIKWNKSGHRLLAIGCEMGNTIVLDPESGRTSFRSESSSPVATLEWNGHSDLVAGHNGRIKHYDLRSLRTEIASYPVFDYNTEVTQLKWNDNILAAAGADCIRLWDIQYGCDRAPLHELRQQRAEITCMEFCPMQRNVFATGGSHSIWLWNVQ